MTRETKIGLLVGLAFIIVIGILLSDHLTSTNEPQQAALAQVAGNVRTGVTVPGSGQAPPITTIPPTASSVAPQQTVLTKEELTPPKPPVEIVQIGGAQPQQSSQHAGGSSIALKAPTEPPAPREQGVAGVDSNSPAVARPTEPVSGAIADTARRMGEDVVPVDRAGMKADGSKPLAVATLPPGARQYKAETGDTLSKMAGKLMGGNTSANRAAIVAANASLQQNANMVVSGRTYVIPPSSGAASTVAAPTPAQAQTPTQVATTDKPAAGTSSDPQYVYTVKPGDSLTRIAVTQLGSADAVPAIVDLNKDVLKGKDIIHPNMKLRLPAKPYASAE
jgi:nucleoid-associated protein YgaU